VFVGGRTGQVHSNLTASCAVFFPVQRWSLDQTHATIVSTSFERRACHGGRPAPCNVFITCMNGTHDVTKGLWFPGTTVRISFRKGLFSGLIKRTAEDHECISLSRFNQGEYNARFVAESAQPRVVDSKTRRSARGHPGRSGFDHVSARPTSSELHGESCCGGLESRAPLTTYRRSCRLNLRTRERVEQFRRPAFRTLKRSEALVLPHNSCLRRRESQRDFIGHQAQQG
jgi:hypothetical protein